MPVRFARPSIWLALLLGLSVVWGAESRAAGLYTVTDLGPSYGPKESEAQALHPMLGLTLTEVEKSALPSVQVWQGAASPRLVSFQLDPWQNTDSGIVLGTVPSGADRANPLASREYGYTMKQADGSFGPFVPLTYLDPSADPLNSGRIGFAWLDAKGEVLILNGQEQSLTDLNTGTKTDLAKLLPAGALDHVNNNSGPSIIQRALMSADGTIFAYVQPTVSAHFPDGTSEHTLMLAPPLSTPEPSTLASFAVIAIGLAVARRRSQGRPVRGEASRQ